MNVAPSPHDLGRIRGFLLPLAEVPMLLANGWRVADDLAGDPLGNAYALMQPPPVYLARKG